MSKAHDSDLYGDLYGEDDNEFAVPLQEGEDELELQEVPQESEQDEKGDDKKTLTKSDASSLQPSPASNIKTDTHSLPAKPGTIPAEASTEQSQMSYSAQIARQFSAYHQTPSQERQQRTEIPLPNNPNAHAPTGSTGFTAIATHESSATRAAPDRPIRPSEMKDEGKMFVGGLNWDTTDEGLRKYFSEFGKVDACTIMRDPDTGRSRGFAFLTFEEPSSVNAVMVREHYLDGKAIDPKRAIPREEHLRNTRYFVGGLAPATTSESMKAFFGTYGKVVDATVMVDRESGRSKGFGFVTFEDAQDTDRLVGKSDLYLDEKQIEVKMAQPRSQRDQARTTHTSREPYFNDRESRTPPMNVPFIPPPQPQPNPAANMIYQRMIGQMPMMGGGNMPNMPMMNGIGMGMGGMGMNGFNQMGGMNPMGGMGMMAGMNPMMGGMNPMSGMRMGMGPIGGMNPLSGNQMGSQAGMGAGVAMGGMNGMAMGMRPGMGIINPNFNRMAMNSGLGPARTSTRGQHSFHPYSR